MIVGMDFGTTNSGMAVYDGRTVSVLPLDPANANPRILRSALYVTNEQAIHIGRAAVEHYYRHNIGRVVKTRKVWIGEIEVYAEDLYYVTDAYAWVDISEPGRLLLSIKSRLREDDHPGAVIGQNFYSLEDLIALYLTATRLRAEQQLGREIREVVLGRPVHYSTDRDHDRLAQGRLLQAAFRAGYETVYLQLEPVAAALSYETTISRPQNVLVFDFGGGTLDITVMRLGDPGNRQVLSTGGLPVAGDVFDRKLTRAKLPYHFGEGSHYGPRHDAKPIPRWIYDAFSDWQTIIELQSLDNRHILQDIARTAQRRYQLEALISLVTSNYGLRMFDEVEKAKRILSEKRGAEILLDGPDFKVREFVTRSEFERIIQPELLTTEAELLRTLEASGLTAGEVDAVVRTGGSAQIPAFYELLCRHFGSDKVQSVDVFSSVTAGLGIYAHQIETGTVDARPYTAADVVRPPQARGSRPRITQVNLSLMQKRLLMEEGRVTRAEDGNKVLILLGEGRALRAIGLPDEGLGVEKDPVLTADFPVQQALIAAADERLLVLTSFYRFLLTSPRQLLDLQDMGLHLADLHRLGPDETLCTMASWSHARVREHLLLATTRGFARAYPMHILRDSIEAPVPLKLDHPLPGLPVAAFGVQNYEVFLLFTRHARGVRWAVDALDISGTQVINCGKDDQVRFALPTADGDNVLLLTEDGYGRLLPPDTLPFPARPNQKGRALVARRSELAGAGKAPVWAVITDHLLPVVTGNLSPTDSTRTERVLQLAEGDHVQCLVCPSPNPEAPGQA